MSSNIRIQRICGYCGNEFEARTTVTQFCGDACAKKAYKAKQKAAKIENSNQETRRIIAMPIEEIKANEFLTIPEVSKLIRISRRTVYRLIEKGELKAGKLGRRTIIKRSDIDRIFEQPKH
jgi:excisionase family DNA binding protein